MPHKADWKITPSWSDVYKLPKDHPDYIKYWEEHKRWRKDYNTCAECGSEKLTLSNHSAMWGDGDLHCENGHYVRMFDSG